MKHNFTRIAMSCFALLLSGFLTAPPNARCASIRIIMKDGTSVEVPYYWEEGGEVKFEIPGGVTGVPKGQVASTQEIINSGAFDPAGLLGSSEVTSGEAKENALQTLVEAKTSSGGEEKKLSVDEGLEALKAEETSKEEKAHRENITAPLFNLEAEFTDLVRIQGNGVSVVIHDVLSSRTDLRNKSIVMALYDGEGRLVQRKPCDIQELDVDQPTARKLGVNGRLFSVTANVRPDPNIKRYEFITAP